MVYQITNTFTILFDSQATGMHAMLHSKNKCLVVNHLIGHAYINFFSSKTRLSNWFYSSATTVYISCLELHAREPLLAVKRTTANLNANKNTQKDITRVSKISTHKICTFNLMFSL